MDVKIEPSWGSRLNDEFEAPYFQQLTDFVKQEYRQWACYPPGNQIFNAFNLCPFNAVKVVIIGQDPYHEPGQAEGLCFSVADGVRFPPSLQNIFKEIESDLGRPQPSSGSLRRWAEQGVLLLNATLTVRAHQAASHARHGWETFTDAAIRAWQRNASTWCLCSGAATRKRKGLSSTARAISSSPRPTPRPSRPIAVSSATTISPAPTIFWCSTEKRQLFGK